MLAGIPGSSWTAEAGQEVGCAVFYRPSSNFSKPHLSEV